MPRDFDPSALPNGVIYANCGVVHGFIAERTRGGESESVLFCVKSLGFVGAREKAITYASNTWPGQPPPPPPNADAETQRELIDNMDEEGLAEQPRIRHVSFHLTTRNYYIVVHVTVFESQYRFMHCKGTPIRSVYLNIPRPLLARRE